MNIFTVAIRKKNVDVFFFVFFSYLLKAFEAALVDELHTRAVQNNCFNFCLRMIFEQALGRVIPFFDLSADFNVFGDLQILA